MQKITPFLWFNDNAEEAMNFYTSIFKNSKVSHTAPGPGGTMMVGVFELDGVEFMVLNGGPMFTFNESISFMVHCQNQEEVDYYWGKLLEGGKPSQCGWLKDKFGVSWQVVPTVLGSLLGGPDPEGAARAMQAMLQMVKLDIAELQRAYDNS